MSVQCNLPNNDKIDHNHLFLWVVVKVNRKLNSISSGLRSEPRICSSFERSQNATRTPLMPSNCQNWYFCNKSIICDEYNSYGVIYFEPGSCCTQYTIIYTWSRKPQDFVHGYLVDRMFLVILSDITNAWN